MDHFLSTYGLDPEAVLFVPYGSRVYGTASDQSDEDYLAIVSSDKVTTGTEYRHGTVNAHIYTREDFRRQLQDHKVQCLEAYFLPQADLAKQFPFRLDKATLRHQWSEKASNSFVKAKKKIDKERDYYVGWKSLFHSLRILNFGIQIATSGRITDYAAANDYWFTILQSRQYNWTWFKTKFQPVYNALASEFRLAAPKE